MKEYILVLLFLFVIPEKVLAQEYEPTEGSNVLFQDQFPLHIRLQYSSKQVRKNTNDSTYVNETLWYKNGARWDSIRVELRARGNFRKKYCTFLPIKLKIDKSEAKGSPLEGNKKLKLVLPCKEEQYANDFVLKEYLAYKLYEVISPHHFKTRLVDLEFTEERRKRVQTHLLKGILIEDIDLLAKRVKGQQIKKNIHPLQQDDLSSVRNSFFQFMIGNTDFSARSGHNDKLMFLDNRIIYIPYDFDMSGLVNASYATVSGLDNISVNISSVTQRVYKGYARDAQLFEQVRQDFLDKQMKIMSLIDSYQGMFESPEQFQTARSFTKDFFEILESEVAFKQQILNRARK